MPTEVTGQAVWDMKFEGDKIPGSSRVPVAEIRAHFDGKLEGRQGLDLGSGSGRSTALLRQRLGCEVHALDLSFGGLKNTFAESRVQANAEFIPYKNETFDFVSICGVMTNLVGQNEADSKKIRKEVADEIMRCLKSGGVAVISDFCAEHNLTNYAVDYDRHALITMERGTIAVFSPEAKISFRNMNNEQVAALKESPDLIRFAHHYEPAELIKIYRSAGFKIPKYSIEVGTTPSGNPIENIILVATK